MIDQQVELLDCGHPESDHSSITRGYGQDTEGRRFCYACCADQDKAYMEKWGRTALYLQGKEVTNWPGSLRFLARVKTGRHNIAGIRRDAWFTDHWGNQWHGVQYGDYTQIIHCKRLRKSAQQKNVSRRTQKENNHASKVSTTSL